MRELRKKQAKMYKLMKILLVFSVAFIVVYIGVEPMVAKESQTVAIICSYLCDAFVIASMIVLFLYYSKYGKADNYLSRIEHELADAGYYLTARMKKTLKIMLKQYSMI